MVTWLTEASALGAGILLTLGTQAAARLLARWRPARCKWCGRTTTGATATRPVCPDCERSVVGDEDIQDVMKAAREYMRSRA